MEVDVKLTLGRYRFPGKLVYTGDRIYFKGFGYNPKLNAEIKAMEGHKYHGYDPKPRKIWSVKQSPRNEFQIKFLAGEDPYLPYDGELGTITSERPLYDHQKEMAAHILTRHYCIFACEMGTGKSLAAIEAVEQSGVDDYWYVGPKAGVEAFRRELIKWEAKIWPKELLTYEGMVKKLKHWDGSAAPQFVIFDECSKIKTPSALCSKCARQLADSVRSEWGDKGYVVLMSGTPAPKTPIDWWHQCEVACPGFIREGTIGKFKARLCLTEQRQSITGGVYPHIVTWLDNEDKCATCGEERNALAHSEHPFTKSRNEIKLLYERMKGLVLVKFKKDCLDLPEKQYELVNIKPTVDVLRAAKLIKVRSSRAIQALTLLRELSDGFQYVEKITGTEDCPGCFGQKTVITFVPKEEVDVFAPNTSVSPDQFVEEEVPCDNCAGTGVINSYARDTREIASPKDQIFIDLLDEHEDVGRFVVWGGFTGTLDRLINLTHKHGWATLRVDGKGYKGVSATGENISKDILLDAMDASHKNKQKLLEDYPKVCFIGHPQAGGMALTLTSSPTSLFYSNCFSGEARMQAEDRIHRAGMDKNRACRIIDLIHLPTDKLVLDNLKKKKRLQNLSMGELSEALDDQEKRPS